MGRPHLKLAPTAGPTSVVVDDTCDVGAIYEPDTNLCILRRARLSLPDADDFGGAPFEWAREVSPHSCDVESMAPHLPDTFDWWRDDVRGLVGLFCDLFETTQVGLRVTRAVTPMCPRFHVDLVVCRLITTYAGAGTEWLDNAAVRRDARGRPVVDEAPLREPPQQLLRGDIGFFKGETWPDNRGRGVVHRSPHTAGRLVLTLDLL